MQAVGVQYKNLNAAGFYAALSSLSIPRTALKTGADWSGR
jgi:hypothetical protein